MEVLRYDRRVTRSRDILEDTSQKDSSIFWPWSMQSVTPEIRDVASRWNAAALLLFSFFPQDPFSWTSHRIEKSTQSSSSFSSSKCNYVTIHGLLDNGSWRWGHLNVIESFFAKKKGPLQRYGSAGAVSFEIGMQ